MTNGSKNELVIVRHGQAHSNVAGVLAGPGCQGLTADGRAAARAVADRIHSEGPMRTLVCSTTRRAMETAEIVSARTQVPVIGMRALRVADPGSTEGTPWARWRTMDAADRARRGAESWSAYLERASTCLAELMAGSPGRVVVVGHTETVFAAFALLLGTADLGRLGIGVDYTAVTEFRVVGGKWQLFRYNDVNHIPAGIARYPGARSSASSIDDLAVGGHDVLGRAEQAR
ncbi:histidine phosphatase family protein [Nocardia gamkensis]|uniref:Histidine phosphatase family protein n=1 Tax=Nocardia gamkensis TaxID=352869 RepID=A0A7X6L5L4_9NOCA|nr:histidine phosphatase family protein [Nocardia gamkensis]NKY28259.1 histidine phosphatase family protein [Nocardia gamkensis]NQE70716.1 Phosphoglycerate mutase (2,3-diphosphoglycerate-independent) [Nocardia gamkensis]